MDWKSHLAEWAKTSRLAATDRCQVPAVKGPDSRRPDHVHDHGLFDQNVAACPTKTTTVPDEERGVMRDVSWEFYDRLSDAIGEHSHIRIAYDGKDIEIMTLGPKHERLQGLARRIYS